MAKPCNSLGSFCVDEEVGASAGALAKYFAFDGSGVGYSMTADISSVCSLSFDL
jgi:hypothetical protein